MTKDDLDGALLGNSENSPSSGEGNTLSPKTPTMKENMVSLLKKVEEQAEQNAFFFKRLEENETNTKSTSDLVKFGFIVIIATTAATVVGAIAVLITTMVSLFSLWHGNQDSRGSSPVNSCAVIGKQN